MLLPGIIINKGIVNRKVSNYYIFLPIQTINAIYERGAARAQKEPIGNLSFPPFPKRGGSPWPREGRRD
jgi:hypothetical protein